MEVIQDIIITAKAGDSIEDINKLAEKIFGVVLKNGGVVLSSEPAFFYRSRAVKKFKIIEGDLK